jgi:putative phage-type endonuclease
MQQAKAVENAEFHEARRLGIGGSDCAPALGMSKWKTPLQLYLEKIGESEPQDETWDMARGKAMEPLLRQHFADTFGVEVRLPKSAMVSEKYPFMRYSPDGLCDGKVLPEFKTARYAAGWGTPGTDEVPQEYLLQVQHGLIVTGYEVARPSVSIGFGEPVYYEVPPDKELQEMIIEREAEFWQRVQDRNPPDPISNDDVALRWRNVHPGNITATPEVFTAMLKLIGVREDIKTLEIEKENCEVFIKAFMGEKDVLIRDTGETMATWKERKGGERINAKRLRAEQPVIAAQYTETGEPGRTFLVK